MLLAFILGGGAVFGFMMLTGDDDGSPVQTVPATTGTTARTTAVPATTATPATTPALPGIPDFVAAAMTQAKVIRYDDFDDGAPGWVFDAALTSFGGGEARFDGPGGAACCHVFLTGSLAASGEAAVVTFRFSEGSYFTVNIDDGEFQTTDYLRFGIWHDPPWAEDEWRFDVLLGTEEPLANYPRELSTEETVYSYSPLEAEVRYHLLIGSDPDGARMIVFDAGGEPVVPGLPLSAVAGVDWLVVLSNDPQWQFSFGLGADSQVTLEEFWVVRFARFADS